MSERKIARRRLKKNAVGDRRERITIYKRSIKPPALNSASFSEDLDKVCDLWTKVETIDLQRSGISRFNDVNLNDEQPTHRFTIRFNKDVSAENIIGWKGNYYRILTTINPEERDEDLELYSVLKGASDLEANQ